MGMSSTPRSGIIAALGTGAVSIATVIVSGKTELEGREHYPYKDVVGIIIVCDGHIGNDIVWDKYYSDKECDALTRKDMTRITTQVDPHIRVQTIKTQWTAIYSFAYNVDATATINSTLLEKLNAKDYAGICSELKRWVYADGKKWKGLMNQRDVEYEVYTWSKRWAG